MRRSYASKCGIYPNAPIRMKVRARDSMQYSSCGKFFYVGAKNKLNNKDLTAIIDHKPLC